jgi:hypothetical protein
VRKLYFLLVALASEGEANLWPLDFAPPVKKLLGSWPLEKEAVEQLHC